MTVFPSYTEGVFRVANSDSDAPITDISVFNAVGQLVFQKKNNAHSEVIDLSAMPSNLPSKRLYLILPSCKYAPSLHQRPILNASLK